VAKQTIVLLTDDLDGSEAEVTMSFGFDGLAYDIDLSGANAQAFREIMGKYLAASTRKGRMVVSGAAASAPHRYGPPAPAQATADRDLNRKIREWAEKVGYHLAVRGRIPQHIVNAYHTGRVPERENTEDALPGMPEVLKATPEFVEAANRAPAKKAAPAKVTRQTLTRSRAGSKA
jgi:nucleoid-associated protein Lsr2